MSSDHVGLEEFLRDQSTPRFTATIEALEGKPDLVKVTPWTAASGQCMCHLAMNVRKSAFEGVTPTSDTHTCCGKTLKIVELHMKKGETLAAEDVFGQLIQSAQKSADFPHAGREVVFSNPMPGYIDGLRQLAARFGHPGTPAEPWYGPGQGNWVPHPGPGPCYGLKEACAGCGSNTSCNECRAYFRACLGFDPFVEVGRGRW